MTMIYVINKDSRDLMIHADETNSPEFVTVQLAETFKTSSIALMKVAFGKAPCAICG